MKFAYADPPYLGCGKLYAAHHEHALEWDKPKTHANLIARLVRDFPDGWAMSLSSPSLKVILPMCPDDCRVTPWVKPFAVYKPNVNPAYAWERLPMTACTHCEAGRHRYLGPIHSDPFHIVFEEVFPCTNQMEKSMKPLCIYHGKCADGFTAAWAVRACLGDIEFFPGVYQEPPPDVTGRDVIIVDFSYKRPVLLQMAEAARSILVLDHHKTAAEDLAGFPAPPAGPYDPSNPPAGIHALFDMDRSGAGLAWDYFHPGVERRPLINFAEDRDLWRFALAGSREVSAYIFSNEYSFDNWDRINAALESNPASVIAMGTAIERKHHKDVAELVEVCKRRVKIGGVEVWAASLPYTLTSDAGHLMAKGEPFAACYWDTPEGRVFSLRSTDEGADVSAIAKQYGGGGHRNASGFKVPLSEIGQFEIAA